MPTPHDVSFQRLPRSGWAIGMAARQDDVEIAKKLQAAINETGANGELNAIFAIYRVQVVKP